MNTEKLKSRKGIGLMFVVGLLIAGGSASVLLDTFGQSEGEGTVSQSIEFNEGGNVSFTMDSLNAGDIHNNTFEVTNNADSPIEIEYNNSVEILDGSEPATDTPEDYVKNRVPLRFEPTDERVDIAEVSADGTLEDLLEKPLFYRVNVLEGNEIGALEMEIETGENNISTNIDTFSEKGTQTVEFTGVDSYDDGSETDMNLNSLIDTHGSETVSEVRLENTASTGLWELHEFVVKGTSEYPEDMSIDTETIPSDSTVERSQVTVVDSYLRDGLQVNSTTEIIPPNSVGE